MKFALFFISMSILVSLVSCKKESSSGPKPVAVNESSNWLGTSTPAYSGPEIVRLAWFSILNNFTSDGRFQELKESGITHNIGYSYASANEAELALNAAQKAGIKVFVYCPEIYSDPEGIAARFKNHPALCGYYLGDEPTSDLFSDFSGIADRIRSVDNIHPCYINLFPIIANDPVFGKGTENYKEYVNDFNTKFKPEFISYDFYTIYYRQGSPELITDPQMFENLEIIRDIALTANKDFWAFCLTTSHRISANGTLFPEPNIGFMRLYVYSDLAYGAQGIQYFTYWLPASSLDPSKDYYGAHWISAPISFEGVKGPTYDLLKTINTEIKNLSFVFADAKVKWVRHTGTTVPKGTTKLTTELGNTPFTKLISSGGVIVTLLEKGENSYLVVVNRDPAKKIDLTLEVKSAVKRVLKSGALIDAEGKLKITEGDVAIYKW